jgi:manganese transport protein
LVSTTVAAAQTLAGERRGLRAVLPFLGPAFIAAVAYVDPGNFATNMAGGAQFGYALGWVVLLANLMAMLVQTLSAKLGIATGRSLPEVCRDRLPRRVVLLLWVQAEAIAMATDLAEFTGAALGLSIVFGLPIWLSALLAAAATFTVLAMEVGGFRRLEAAITGLVGVVVLAFGLELFVSRPSASGVAFAVLDPRLPAGAGLLAVSIVGATVMPHVIYLHSALTKDRVTGDRAKIFRFGMVDVLSAMTVAGAVNLAMLALAAAVFHSRGLFSAGSSLGQVAGGLNSYLGDHAGTIFGVALLISGVASSSVGTLSGQVVMAGFLRRQVPVFIRRTVTMIPALVLIAAGFSLTRALVLSQVFLSFGIPFALVPLVVFTADRRVMGSLVNRRATSIAAVTVTAVIVALNVFLLATS